MNLSDSLVCWALAGRRLGRDQGLRLAHRQREHLVHPPLDLGRDPRERAGPLAGPRHQHLALDVPVGLGAHQHQQDGPGSHSPRRCSRSGLTAGNEASLHTPGSTAKPSPWRMSRSWSVTREKGLEIITGPTQNYSFPELNVPSKRCVYVNLLCHPGWSAVV
ncbi:uncharacterized protein LOC134728930 [Pan paniscus]|uniref:uncharacterized protein LOC134728930 n=1 Tax=Pan paniscus TaxID=9597 RepID=UPI0030042C7D